MKKKLNIDSITNELEGASLFFTRSSPPPLPDKTIVEKEKGSTSGSPISAEQPVGNTPSPKIAKPKPANDDTVVPRHHATTTPRYHDTTVSQDQTLIVGLVRKAVKEFGKEAATHRFTEIEKKEIADLIYTYKNRGVKTSENEITRIAVNYVVEDYKENGENSVLHKILKALKE